MESRVSGAVAAASRSGGGLWLDLGLYGLSALFAWYTAVGSALPSHRAWAVVAVFGYAAATVVVLAQLAVAARRPAATAVTVRAAVTAIAWVATALLPLVLLARDRAAGTPGRAQEEVLVVEAGGERLWSTGTPYLGRADIAALPVDERLLAYLPYQPGMALFGSPHAADPGAWWSDARIWFALVTVAAIGAGLYLLRRTPAELRVRALQVATVLPICALTLATGGDDLPVLALCLLAFALAATGRAGGSGAAIGAAAALKLLAWPVLLVLGVYFLTRGGRQLMRYAVFAVGIPVVTAIPVVVVNPGAVAENILAFPFGRGLVTSPAASPLPGRLIAAYVPGGRSIALALLAAAALAIAVWLVRRPPRTVADAAILCGVSLLAATLLLPATRFGYLLYPAAFLVWAPALRARTPQVVADAYA